MNTPSLRDSLTEIVDYYDLLAFFIGISYYIKLIAAAVLYMPCKYPTFI